MPRVDPPGDEGSGALASPCIDICRMDEASGLCEGCLRTLEEIAEWSSASGERRRAILAAIAARRTQRRE
ncbi:MAG: hypothetical protein OHK0026_07530 [Rhodocyclaceae bacterium]